jgi:hypothetical protein
MYSSPKTRLARVSQCQPSNGKGGWRKAGGLGFDDVEKI